MTLQEFQELGLQEGNKVMLSYMTKSLPEPIKTLITIKRIIIEESDFYLANVRSKYFGQRIVDIERVDNI